ncbi:NUDIX domain-containing protein [Halobacteria archaeon AArc-curdl1]|uniref:NUDIX domain-containing protein n=1 Tax=Natronosalvus hydrolyticus TaxID=2979988 RepID=A0AAP2ZDU2_9EURY|nr:NUDIX domain-containing protein [Halobacteria archaeon AArc-curdl1]
MTDSTPLDPTSHESRDVPREQQELTLSASHLEALEPWATDGTARAAAARVTDELGRIALIKNGWTDGWFLPGGAVEPGESSRDAARREIREETGLEATIEHPLVVLEQTYVDEADGETWYTAQFIVFNASATGPIPDASSLGVDDEPIHAARWFESLPERIHDGDLLRPYL